MPPLQPPEESITLKRSMDPVGAEDARLLILGSLPGDRSLLERRYYAHPQNQFWRLLGAAIGEDLAALDYEARLQRLAARGIALWDVVGEARRPGSLDSAIRGASPNEVRAFAQSHSSLRAIGFNGRTAARFGRLALGDLDSVELIDLPSSSAAYTLSMEDKARSWARLGMLACPGEAATLGR